MSWLLSSLPHNNSAKFSAWNTGALGLFLIAMGGCTFPHKAPPLSANINSVQLMQSAQGGWEAMPPNCTNLRESSRFNNWNTTRDDLVFGCATYTNLARQLAHPADLVKPEPYAGTDARYAGDAVQRYLDNQVTPLLENNSTRGLEGN